MRFLQLWSAWCAKAFQLSLSNVTNVMCSFVRSASTTTGWRRIPGIERSAPSVNNLPKWAKWIRTWGNLQLIGWNSSTFATSLNQISAITNFLLPNQWMLLKNSNLRLCTKVCKPNSWKRDRSNRKAQEYNPQDKCLTLTTKHLVWQSWVDNYLLKQARIAK